MSFPISSSSLEYLLVTPHKVQLKAIAFCPPSLLDLNGRKTNPSEYLFDRLPAAIRPQPSQFQPQFIDPRIQIEEIPTVFARSPFDPPLSLFNFPGIEEFGQVVQYLFTDHQAISVKEIFYHEYVKLVPLELLPLNSGIDPEVSMTSWLNLIADKTFPLWGSLRKTELALMSVLIRASKNSKLIDLWLSSTQDSTVVRSACLLKNVKILPEFRSHWKLTSEGEWDKEGEKGWASLLFNKIPYESNAVILQTFEINPKENSLYFHPYHRLIELGIETLDHPPGINYREWLERYSQNTPELKFSMHRHSVIERISAELDQKLIRNGYPTIRCEELQVLTGDQIKPQVRIESTGEISFCRRIETNQKEFEVWNLPQTVIPFLKGFQGGIGSVTDRENKWISQERKGQKRGRDLRVLKHSGIFSLVFLEAACFVLDKTDSEGNALSSVDDLFNRLFRKLGAILFEIEKKAGFIELTPAPSLDQLCSKNVIQLIKDFVFNLIQNSKTQTDSIFIKSGEIRLENAIETVLKLFQVILSKIAMNSRGQCYLKPRLSAFSSFIQNPTVTIENLPSHWPCTLVSEISGDTIVMEKAERYLLSHAWLPPNQVLHTLLPLKERGFELFYNGLPFKEMDADDFKSEFTLLEAGSGVDPKKDQSIDWFELHPQFFFKGTEIKDEQLQRMSREGILEFQGKVYLIRDKQLPSIQRLENFWAKIQGTQKLALRRKSEDTYFPLPRSQTLEILALRASGVAVKGGVRWQQICKFYDSLAERKELLSVTPSVKAELKHYQKVGVQWLLDLYELGLGGILADDMGLGKTIQTLSFLESLRVKKGMGSALIVVPTSLTYNWLSESSRFTPEIPIRIFQSKTKDNAIQFIKENQQSALICTYGLFTEHQELFATQPWNVLIFDEAQNLKNITAKRTTASRSISARFKLCLTGTPLENHLGEFYSLLDLVVSGSLGDLSTFREKYVNTERLDPAELRYLKLKAKPLILRRTKSEILKELPPKIESTIKLPFEPKQEKIYRDIALSWNEKVKDAILEKGEANSQLLMLTALLRLRQACSDPGAIPNIKYSEEPPKITVLMEALEEITESGESALVFTQFIHTFERIKKCLRDQKIRSFSLHGGTSRTERERILREFQETQEGSVLLMTLKTGGVGLNLVKASYVFHIEPWWNPAVENQATDRAHRIGQVKPVQVYRYLMRESVEEKIEILKARKSARFDALFSTTDSETESESESPAQPKSDLTSNSHLLSQADFNYLLEL